MPHADRARQAAHDPGSALIGYYLTHPQVEVDPDTPVPQWRLSTSGHARIVAIAERAWLTTISRIVSSKERKAVETAKIIAARRGAKVEIHAEMGENDRSSTGFLQPDRFEAAADEFFCHPQTSWNGWESAVDAQSRIVSAVERTLARHGCDRAVLFVGHGAVGTLLKCHIANRAISRSEDQPAGGGNVFAFGLATRQLLCEWTPVEEFDGAGNDGRHA